MAPRKKQINEDVNFARHSKQGLAFDTLSRIGEQFGVPVLAGMSKPAVRDIPPNTTFLVVTEQHWLLCLKGVYSTLVFDSLGLPYSGLAAICHGVMITPWNKFGYQSEMSTVCGYYIIAVLIAIKNQEMVHNGDIDSMLAHICPYHVPRPSGMTEWYSTHRHHNKQLKMNDDAVVEYVTKVYPHLGMIDRHAPVVNSSEPHTGMIGSPIYVHAGINASSAALKYMGLSRVLKSNDPQRPRENSNIWAMSKQDEIQPQDLPRGTIENAFEKDDDFEDARGSGLPKILKSRKTLNKVSKRKSYPNMTVDLRDRAEQINQLFDRPHNNKVLQQRATLNAFNPPGGLSAAGNDGNVNQPKELTNIVIE